MPGANSKRKAVNISSFLKRWSVASHAKADSIPELEEAVVAVSFDGSQSWSLLSPGKRQLASTDEQRATYSVSS